MRARNPRLSFLPLLLSTTGALGCSGTDSPADVDLQNGTSELAAGMGVSMTDRQACIITTSSPAAARSYVWRSYLAEQRIVRDIAIDAQGKPLPYDSPANTSTYEKLDIGGHALVRAVEAGGGELQRVDFARDTHGNIVSQSEVHTAHRDLEAPAPEEPSTAHDFVNHYSSQGLLEKHNRADSSGGTDYQHDADGRCQLIRADDGIEHRDYDADGRLSAQFFGPMNPDAPTDPVASPSSVTRHRYDDRGRPLILERDGGGPAALPVDGQPDFRTEWSWADDGSCTAESVDLTGDSSNDTVQTWSAGCAGLQASIPVPGGNACATD